ncbi:MAG: type II toxin-antitoxin system Phd/YefM family antitoxin [Lentisphaeria bacterium]|nr:type II toxin-antitoxin system Phd/YefM family antitoxin [Candidatus Neomarinimicrobiota bacterium]MCF7842536.1 type II toxin-antitoxin system Phd/YefM family antitoxin [Lentisphaeria bacterium]
MQRIKLDQDIHSLSEFRANIKTLIDKMKANKRPLVLTQNGKSSAVVMDVVEYEAMQEKLELLSDIQTAEDQLAKGQGVNHNQAKEKILKNL